MPVEIRHLLFRGNEVASAIRDHRAKLRQPLPSGSVARCAVSSEDRQVRVALTIESDDEHGRRTTRSVLVEGPALAAALILYCKDRRIPLPSDASKELRKVGDLLMLVVTRNPNNQPVPRLEMVAAAPA